MKNRCRILPAGGLGGVPQLQIPLFPPLRKGDEKGVREYKGVEKESSDRLGFRIKSGMTYVFDIDKDQIISLADKAEDAISKSSLSAELKQQYRKGKEFGKIRGLTILYKNKRDVAYARQLIALKTSIK